MAGMDVPGLDLKLGGRSKGRMGEKLFTLKDSRKTGGVDDLLESQDLANELLTNILDKMDELGGESSGGLSSAFGGDEGGEGGGFSDIAEEFLSKRFGSFGEMFSGAGAGGGGGGFFGRFGSMFGGSGSGGGGTGGGASAGIMMVLQIINKVLEEIRAAMKVINDTVAQGISKNIANQKEYLGPISARLQSFEVDSTTEFKKISSLLRNTFTNSRYINQQQVLENISRLVEQGINYNLEDRAYLATIADRTVKTFDLLEPSLNRLIRLQQSDLTRPQMGAEAYLTKYLNRYYQDTSYLNSMYDTVTAQLLDATSQMSFDQTTSFLFNVQKWLSALYSVGMSDSAVTTIAQGINYLGSGNIGQLLSNQQLNTLFAMSAQQAGLSYSNLLTYGLSGENVDKLLYSMVKYLQNIANNTSSEVLRSEYGRIFGGLSVSDLRAIQNLTSGDLQELNRTSLTYEQGFEEVAKQIKLVPERTSTAEQIENMFNNLIYSIGAEIGENEEAYMSWFYSDLLDQFTGYIGDIIPGILGDILDNAVGASLQGAKLGEVIKALKNIDMFKTYSFSNLRDTIIDYYREMGDERTFADSMRLAALETTDAVFDAYRDSDALYIASKALGMAITPRDLEGVVDTANTLKTGGANWEYFSQLGATDPFLWDKWTQFTIRGGPYSSSISLGDNAFAEAAAKVKAEEITGIDDSITRSIDELYNGLFGDQARPIKVIMVDMDGNVLSTATQYREPSNFEDFNSRVPSPQRLFSEAMSVKAIE